MAQLLRLQVHQQLHRQRVPSSHQQLHLQLRELVNQQREVHRHFLELGSPQHLDHSWCQECQQLGCLACGLRQLQCALCLCQQPKLHLEVSAYREYQLEQVPTFLFRDEELEVLSWSDLNQQHHQS